jgi:uncharacterized protein YaiE (UPF0345 family)
MTTMKFENVTVEAKANVYFGGKVVSHTVLFADGSRKTVGLIYEGEYHFGTDAAERMEIIAGACEVVLDGSAERLEVAAGGAFEVPAQSGFTIRTGAAGCEYVCSFLT